MARQTFKRSKMSKIVKGITISQMLFSFSLSRRTTHSTTNVMLAELYMNRNLRTTLDLNPTNIESIKTKLRRLNI